MNKIPTSPDLEPPPVPRANVPRVPLAPDRYLLIHDSVHGKFPGTVEASSMSPLVFMLNFIHFFTRYLV